MRRAQLETPISSGEGLLLSPYGGIVSLEVLWAAWPKSLALALLACPVRKHGGGAALQGALGDSPAEK